MIIISVLSVDGSIVFAFCVWNCHLQRGDVYKRQRFGFVRPDDQRVLKDIYIPEGKEKGAVSGHKVVVELTSYGGQDMNCLLYTSRCV